MSLKDFKWAKVEKKKTTEMRSNSLIVDLCAQILPQFIDADLPGPK